MLQGFFSGVCFFYQKTPPPNVFLHAINKTKKVEEMHLSILTVFKNNQDNKGCSIVHVSANNKPPPPPNLLQNMHVAKHVVNGDGNCLYHAIARFIDHDCHGDTFVAQQLRKNGSKLHAKVSCCAFRRRDYCASVKKENDIQFMAK